MSDDLRELYQEVILDHSRDPRNFRELPDCVHTAHGENPLCGDRLDIYLTLDGDGKITDAAFKGRGCAISMASASMMTEIIRGLDMEKAKALFERFHDLVMGSGEADISLDEDDLDKLQVLAGVRQFPMRVKCATLAWHTMNAALEGDAVASTE
ncbi:Fe-S cluster assembly sulfur transfer protein SufU [Oceanibacterium hippocampi]|uniref:NifU-like protein n=1 Tax=Oceanibacterium hippocampi TaxID=745714 RepID=A0A1Y5TAE7_9PROT|nr:SUF system NifU family Fe-S cluster assembly protein [Oceanibacterium hippocampi]SLN57598.1 NifU-like protein [Oceanibacterium hippocampi]